MKMTPLSDGSYVPTDCVEALNFLDTIWPGATLPMARAAIVQVVLEAFEKAKNDRDPVGVNVETEKVAELEAIVADLAKDLASMVKDEWQDGTTPESVIEEARATYRLEKHRNGKAE